MKRITSIITFLFCAFIGSFSFGQSYPVQTNIHLTGPFTNHIPDYLDPGNSKFQVALQITDANIGVLNVRLKLKLTGPNGEMVTRSTYAPPMITLNYGVPTILDGTDLASYFDVNNLTFSNSQIQTAYTNTSNLQEGFWTWCVEVYDATNPTAEVLSTNNCHITFIATNLPPITNLPLCGAVLPHEPTVLFNWSIMPSVLPEGAVETFTFQLYAIPIASYVNVSQVLSMSPIFWTSLPAGTSTYVLNTNEVLLSPQFHYVWRVHVNNGVSGNIPNSSSYMNNGFSVPCDFMLENNDQIAINSLELALTSVATGTTTGKSTWTVTDTENNNNQFDGFKLAYRKAGNPDYTWYEQDVVAFEYNLTQLEANTTYETKLKGYIGNEESDWTAIDTFTTNPEPVLTCGQGVLPTLSPTYEPLNWINAFPGIQVTQGQFTMMVTSISPVVGADPGHFKGTGFMYIPFLHFAMQVHFEDLEIDDQKVARSGDVKVVSQGLDAWLAEQYVNQAGDPIMVSGTIVDTGWVNDTTGWVVNDNGDTTYITVVDPLPTIVHDGANMEYQFWPDGTIIVTPYGIVVSNDHLAITTDKMVHFIDSEDQTYPTDVKEYAHLAENYECIVEGEIMYFVANKSALIGATDLVKAKVHIIGNFDRALLSFRKAFSNDTIPFTYDPDDSICVFTLPEGTSNFSLYAYYDGAKVGKLNVKMFNIVTKNVTIVPLVALNSAITKEAVESAVNTIYRGAHVKLNVTIASQYNTTDFTTTTQFENPDVNLLTKYTAQMRMLRDSYLQEYPLEGEQYLVFIVPSFINQNIDGYMVRGKGLGFVSASTMTNITSFAHTLSHELGHGIGGLKHTWEDDISKKGITNNLLDYNNGLDLVAKQWKNLHDSPPVLSFLDSEEDGSASGLTSGTIPIKWFASDTTIAFLTPGKTVAKFSNKIKTVWFSRGLNDYPENPYLASGLLVYFKYQESSSSPIVVYTAKIVDDMFYGYVDKNGNPFNDYVPQSTNDSLIHYIVGRYNTNAYKVADFVGYSYQTNVSPPVQLFDVSNTNLESISLTGNYTEVSYHNFTEGFFDPASSTYLTEEALSLFYWYAPHQSSETKFKPSYEIFEKIVELRSSYPDIYNKMSVYNFADWDHSTQSFFGITLDQFISATNPLDLFFSSTSVLPEGTLGYFDYVYYDNNYNTLPIAEQVHQFLLHFITVINYKKAAVQSEINALNEACYLGDTFLPSSINSYSKVIDIIDAMSVLECSQICPIMRVKLIDLLLNPGASNLWMTTDDLEHTIDKLVWTTPEDMYHAFLYKISNVKSDFSEELIIKVLVDAVDDRTLLRGDNYNTKIMNWFIKAYNIGDKNTINDVIYNPTNLNDYKKRIVCYNYVGFTKRLFKTIVAEAINTFDISTSFTQPVSPLAQMAIDSDPQTSVTIDNANRKINFKNETLLGFYTVDTSPMVSLDMLEPIIVDFKGTLIDIYSDNKGLAVPAFILYFLERKADAKTTVEVIQTVTDIAALAIPGGALKYLTYADRISSLASMAGSYVGDDYPQVQTILNLTSSVLGIAGALNPSKLMDLKVPSADPVPYLDWTNVNTLTNAEKHVEEVTKLTLKIEEQGSEIVTALTNPHAKNLLINILEGEKKLAKAGNNWDVVAKLDKSLALVRGVSPLNPWINVPFYTKLANYAGNWVGNVFKSSTTTGAVDIAHLIQDGQSKIVDFDHLVDFIDLSEDSKLISSIDNVNYRISGVPHEFGSVMVFRDNVTGVISCVAGSNCFTKDTPVKLTNSHKAIQNIQIGDEVSSYDEKTKLTSNQKVKNIFHKTVNKLNRLIIGNDTIFATAEHPFYTKASGWVKAGLLSVGTLIQTSNGYATITENIEKDTVAEVYNFTVENTHTYYVGLGDNLVHNTCEVISDIIDQLGEVKGKSFWNDIESLGANQTKFSQKIYSKEAWETLFNWNVANTVRRSENGLSLLSKIHKSNYADLLAKLNTLTIAEKTQFIADFGALNLTNLSKFNDNVEMVSAWKIARNNSDQLATDIPFLTKFGEDLKNPVFPSSVSDASKLILTQQLRVSLQNTLQYQLYKRFYNGDLLGVEMRARYLEALTLDNFALRKEILDEVLDIKQLIISNGGLTAEQIEKIKGANVAFGSINITGEASVDFISISGTQSGFISQIQNLFPGKVVVPVSGVPHALRYFITPTVNGLPFTLRLADSERKVMEYGLDLLAGKHNLLPYANNTNRSDYTQMLIESQELSFIIKSEMQPCNSCSATITKFNEFANSSNQLTVPGGTKYYDNYVVD